MPVEVDDQVDEAVDQLHYGLNPIIAKAQRREGCAKETSDTLAKTDAGDVKMVGQYDRPNR
jgi:hypothetical protein